MYLCCTFLYVDEVKDKYPLHTHAQTGKLVEQEFSDTVYKNEKSWFNKRKKTPFHFAALQGI